MRVIDKTRMNRKKQRSITHSSTVQTTTETTTQQTQDPTKQIGKQKYTEPLGCSCVIKPCTTLQSPANGQKVTYPVADTKQTLTDEGSDDTTFFALPLSLTVQDRIKQTMRTSQAYRDDPRIQEPLKSIWKISKRKR